MKRVTEVYQEDAANIKSWKLAGAHCVKYVEIGIGNSWLIRTEIERDDGTEYEKRGIVGPLQMRSVYLRIWFGHHVFIIDAKEGIKRNQKERKAYKFIIGLVSA